ncbi:MAG: response regulator transcription factor, partial [Prevotella sp.]|nr:response regulator transcription factor [Prevotella sp.]
MKILVVDDEVDICEILKFNLEIEGFEVSTVYSAEEALELPLQDYSLILLDVMMGEISGFQMIHILKNNPSTAHIPIILITALDGEDNLVKGLNIGADDYVAKPLSIKELKARVKALLRRSSHPQQTVAPPDDSKIVYQGITIDLNAKTVTCDGRKLVFTKLEFELLSFFLQHPNKVFSREDLLKYCWPRDVMVLDR